VAATDVFLFVQLMSIYLKWNSKGASTVVGALPLCIFAYRLTIACSSPVVVFSEQEDAPDNEYEAQSARATLDPVTLYGIDCLLVDFADTAQARYFDVWRYGQP